jgi:hypothetical protein
LAKLIEFPNAPGEIRGVNSLIWRMRVEVLDFLGVVMEIHLIFLRL